VQCDCIPFIHEQLLQRENAQTHSENEASEEDYENRIGVSLGVEYLHARGDGHAPHFRDDARKDGNGMYRHQPPSERRTDAQAEVCFATS